MMKFTEQYSKAFKYLLPSPFSIAVVLTFLTFILAMVFTRPAELSTQQYLPNLANYWQEGLWDNALLVFAIQMMLMLVLGHSLALTPLVSRLINRGLVFCNATARAAAIVTLVTILVAYFNWGLGLIFGAIFARKVGVYCSKNSIPVNYPLIGAAGYSGLMVWHGGISGSSLTKIAESGHLKSLMDGIIPLKDLAELPDQIGFGETVFSGMNLFVFICLVTLLPSLMYLIGKKEKGELLDLKDELRQQDKKIRVKGMEKIDYSSFISITLGGLILCFAIYQARLNYLISGWNFITPNFINFTLLGMAISLHKNFNRFIQSIDDAIVGAAGILIQFPLYFGIMGLVKGSGLIYLLSDFFIGISTAETFPIYTFFSAGIVNIFVPSGGGQWAIQGPIIIQTALTSGISLKKCIMAFAYGDQLTNMLQPFWALPLLGITGLKAREILPYTLILLLAGLPIFLLGLILF